LTEHFVYVVSCSDGTLYTGYSTDPGARVARHNEGKGSRYTRGRLPVKLVYFERRATGADALRREIQVKRMSREAKLALGRRRRAIAPASIPGPPDSL